MSRPKTEQNHSIRFEGWIHPTRELLSLGIEEAKARYLAICPDNRILEVHEDCNCLGALELGVKGTHFKVMDAEGKVF